MNIPNSNVMKLSVKQKNTLKNYSKVSFGCIFQQIKNLDVFLERHFFKVSGAELEPELIKGPQIAVSHDEVY